MVRGRERFYVVNERREGWKEEKMEKGDRRKGRRMGGKEAERKREDGKRDVPGPGRSERNKERKNEGEGEGRNQRWMAVCGDPEEYDE